LLFTFPFSSSWALSLFVVLTTVAVAKAVELGGNVAGAVYVTVQKV
jgi:hypothetical protein